MSEELGSVYLLSIGLLGEWWHTEPNTTRDEVLDRLVGSPPEATREQIAQRLYGGWPCDKGGTHIYLDAGQFTYTGPNGDLDPEERLATWRDLCAGNIDQRPDFKVDALFTEGCPWREDGLQ